MSRKKQSREKSHTGSQDEDSKSKESIQKKEIPEQFEEDAKVRQPSFSLFAVPEGRIPGGETVIDSAQGWSKLCIKLENDDREFFFSESLKVLGWKVSEKMILMLKRLLPTLKRMEKLFFCNTRMSNSMFTSIINTIPLCASLREVTLDGNPLPNQCYHLLLSDECSLTHLLLRNNQISDEGAALIGCALSTPKSTNKTLLSLSLAFNQIGDVGAEHIAKGLRLNRTLLFLSLANNWIGDKGAILLAGVFCEFALTHDEIMERRRLNFDKLQTPPVDVEVAVLSNEEQSPTDQSPPAPESTSPVNKSKKNDTSKPDEKLSANKKTPKPVKKPDAKPPPPKVSKPPPKPKTDEKSSPPPDEQSEEVLQVVVNPLLDRTSKRRGGEIFLAGNTCLASLNLSGNHLTEKSLPHFLTSLKHQYPVGLLRLCLQRNDFPLHSPTFEKIEVLMSSRDPILNEHFLDEDE